MSHNFSLLIWIRTVFHTIVAHDQRVFPGLQTSLDLKDQGFIHMVTLMLSISWNWNFLSAGCWPWFWPSGYDMALKHVRFSKTKVSFHTVMLILSADFFKTYLQSTGCWSWFWPSGLSICNGLETSLYLKEDQGFILYGYAYAVYISLNIFSIYRLLALVLTLSLADFKPSSSCTLGLVSIKYYIVGYIAMLGAAVFLEGVVFVVSMRGSILVPEPRASMQYLLYLRLGKGAWY